MRNTGTGKYWENEQAAEIPVNGSFLLKYYPKAGMLQHYNVFDRGSMEGKLSKGVTVDLSKLTDVQLDEYQQSIVALVAMEKKMRATMSPSPVRVVAPKPPARSLADVAKELGVG